MPRRPLTGCTEPGCKRLVSRPGPCAEHARQRKRELRQRHVWADYGPLWPEIRRAVLADEPFCPCGQPSVDVDHKTPLRAGGTHTRTNLQALCVSCHSKKTARENGFGGRRL